MDGLRQAWQNLRTRIGAMTVNQRLMLGMVTAALRSVFGELIRQDRLVIVKELELEAPKTKLLATKLKELELAQTRLDVAGKRDRTE